MVTTEVGATGPARRQAGITLLGRRNPV